MFETDRRISLHVVERTARQFGIPTDLLVLFRIVDNACHAGLRESELVSDHLDATAEERRQFERVVTEAYRRVDGALGELIAAFGEGNVIVISDHGFQLENRPDATLYHHTKAPDGIFLAAGPAIRPGRVDGLSLYDVMPLVARLKGFPVAADRAGRVPEEVFDPAFLERTPRREVASYGRRGRVASAVGRAEADDEMMERLRALGYVN